jgi:anti-sigma factor RsiW
MCPDRQVLSLYLDGELPSPWKEKMESHLAQCPQCREWLESCRLISTSLAGAGTVPEHVELARVESAHIKDAQERVWRNLEARERLGSRSGTVRRSASVWRRTISIPLPAAAAAAAVLVITMGVLWLGRPAEQSPTIPQMSLASEDSLNAPDVVPIAANMEGVLQYLESKDSGGDILILRLPESRNFTSSGEPAILKAVDYTRSQY